MASRPSSSSAFAFLPSRKARWGLTVFGLLVLGQGLGKAVDPVGYMAALDAFHVLAPASFGPLKLGSLALVWTVVELLAGVALLYGGLSRAPAKQLTMAGIALALGSACATLSLEAGALARRLPIQNSATFGSYLAQKLAWLALVQEAVVIALLAWLFVSVMKWPSLDQAANRTRPRTLSHA